MSSSTSSPENLRDKYYFLIRRLHSLCGIVPVGVFLVFHLLINASILDSPAAFDQRVGLIHSLGAFLVPVEIVGIFLPILFHAVFGVVIVLSGKPNPVEYSYSGSWRYALQRWTGVIAFLFIMVHLWHMHWLGEPFGGAFFDPHDAAPSAVRAMQMKVFWAPLYILGLVASVFHFVNGIWTALITWGITIGRNAQRKAGYACAILGIALTVMGAATVRHLRIAEPGEAPDAPHARVSAPDGATLASHLPGNES